MYVEKRRGKYSLNVSVWQVVDEDHVVRHH